MAVRTISLFALLALAPLPLFAVETVKSPVVDKGKIEFGLGGKYQHDSALSKDGERELTAEIGYGFTERFKAKAEVEFKEKMTSGFHYDKIKFKTVTNILSEKEGAVANLALIGDLAIADRTDSTHDYTLGVAASKNLFEKTDHTANILVRQDFGDTAANGTNFIYRWQSRYYLSKEFALGFEVFGDTRKKDAFRDQILRVGPMAYGKIPLNEGSGVGYELGYLLGATPATADGMLKWKVKYEVKL